MNLNNKENEFKKILNGKSFLNNKKKSKIFFAPINIALIKYWGKKDEDINIPMTTSISFSSRNLGTKTQIFLAKKDEIILNNLSVDKIFFNRVFEFINLFRNVLNIKCKLKIITYNNIPTASGLASSASGFAALTLALNDFFSLNLTPTELSELARIGSGSACRSIFTRQRFVIWYDRFAKPFEFKHELRKITKNMRAVVIVLDKKQKKISSRKAMNITKMHWLKNKNNIYGKWLQQSKKDILSLKNVKNWKDFGEIIEKNSLLMHEAICEAGINYLSSKTFKILNFVSMCRKNGLFVYATIDAGSNVVMVYQNGDEKKIKNALSNIKNAEILYF